MHKEIVPPTFCSEMYDGEKMEYLFIRIMTDNLHSQHVFEKIGAEKLNTEIDSFDEFKDYLSEKFGKEINMVEEWKSIFDKYVGDKKYHSYKYVPDVKKKQVAARY